MSSPSPSAAHFALPLHTTAEGPTNPSQVNLPHPFVVLIAGGSKGIGLGIIHAYAKAGASGIIIASRSQSSVESAAKTVLKINPRIKILCQPCDITIEGDVKDLADAVGRVFGRLDVLVIGAGSGTKLTHIREGGLKDWPCGVIEGAPTEMERLWRVNVHGPYLLQHYFLPLLEGTKDGAQAIIQISSAAAHYTNAEVMPTSYSLTKFAATRLVELVHEGHKGSGVVAFALQPGGVATGSEKLVVPDGKRWEKLLVDDVGLAGGFCVWLTKEKREWLSGRYLDAKWDVDELVRRKDEIVGKDLLKLRMAC
ncbi:NAD(P)-binding protein [Tothia fuscella]|uniref:NAD(P)-binding protein n=1 Tax=Tothia fuscella TaxID=1048955 RepID=A0A9P4NW81_9PEZI|nr:NAD(P)-binding protein [Tothia fuscella]